MIHPPPRTSPDQANTGWPPGVPYIVGNELCERFSYYGMKSILYIYMAEELYPHYAGLGGGGGEDLATAHFHLFGAAAYALPMIGAILADRLLGKYRTIFWLSLVYCAGHFVLAIFEGTLWGLWTGLGLIALGAGGIKPCVSAHVGDQFGKENWFRLRTVYQIFYFTINFGSTFSMALIPWIFDWRKTRTGFLAEHAVSIAFGIPGVLMAIATVVFFMGRQVFVHKPPHPGGRIGLLDTLSSAALFMSLGQLFFTGGLPGWLRLGVSIAFAVLGFGIFAVRQSMSPDDGFLAVMLYSIKEWFTGKEGPLLEVQSRSALAADDALARSAFFRPAVRRFGVEVARGPHAVLRIMSVFVMVSIFWALFDQSGSSWIRQAKLMRTVNVLGFDILPAQLQTVNPILVMLLIPVMNSTVFPLLEKSGFRVTTLRRMTAGMLFAGLSFVAVALIQARIDAEGPGTVSILWQIVPYVIITISEVLISITGLEFAYSQAPKSMKSTIMGFWLFTIAIGNVLVSLLAEFGKLPLVQFFWVFAGLMFVAGVGFGIRAHFFVERDIIQD
jgi:POT family proton-dependent oligopeptide transporter